MRLTLAAALAILSAPVCEAGEIIDCVAVTVGRSAITLSAVEEQARITAFLNREPADLSLANLRRTAERLIDVTLIRREMEISSYTPPGQAEVEKIVADVRAARAGDFAGALAGYGLDEAALRRHLTLQTQTLRFIELRFRPGTLVSDAEVESFYRETMAPEFVRKNPGKTAPDLEDVRDEIEARLLDQRVDRAMEQWLKEARAQTRMTHSIESCLAPGARP